MRSSPNDGANRRRRNPGCCEAPHEVRGCPAAGRSALASGNAPAGDVEDNRDRAVVDEVDDHVGAKATVFNPHPGRLNRGGERLENGDGEIRCRGGREGRPPALSNVSEQRELGDQQNRSPCVDDTSVHLPMVVGEDPHGDDLRGGSSRIGLIITVGYADEREQAHLDLPHGLTLDGH